MTLFLHKKHSSLDLISVFILICFFFVFANLWINASNALTPITLTVKQAAAQGLLAPDNTQSFFVSVPGSIADQDPPKGLVPCTNTPDKSGNITSKCDFTALMTLVNNIIDFIFKFLVIPIAAIMFFYAGFLLVTSGGNSEARGRAKNIFTNAVLGLVIAIAAWLIIKTILSILGYNGAWIFNGFKTP